MRISNTKISARFIFLLFQFLCLGNVIAQPINVVPMEVTGTITGFDPSGVVLIKDKAGKRIAADVSATRRLPNGAVLEIAPPAFSIVGQKSIDVLKPGSLVRFEAEVVRRRAIEEEITKLTLFTRGPFTELGFLEAELDLADPDFEEKLKEREKAKENRDKRRYVVAGTISKLQNGRMTMLVPDENDNRKIVVQISKDAVVDLELLDFRLAQIGNKIKASGESMQPNHFYATKVEVTLDPDERLIAILKKPELIAKAKTPDVAKDPVNKIAVVDPMPEKDVEAEDPGPKEPDGFSPPPPFKYVPPAKAKNRRKRGLVGRVLKIN